MARPITWLPRLREIREAVRRSSQSHYQAADIAYVFGVSPRTAASLLSVLAGSTITVGKNVLVSQEHLLEFLSEVAGSADAAQMLSTRKSQAQRKRLERSRRGALDSRRRINWKRVRELLISKTATAAAMPENIEVQKERLSIGFRDAADVVEALGWLASLLQTSDGWMLFEEASAPDEGEKVESEQARLERLDAEHIRNWRPGMD